MILMRFGLMYFAERKRATESLLGLAGIVFFRFFSIDVPTINTELSRATITVWIMHHMQHHCVTSCAGSIEKLGAEPQVWL